MIKIDGKITSWTDSARSMIKAAQEVATVGSRHTIESDTGGRLIVVGRTAYTEDDFLVKAAQALKLKVSESGLLGTEIEL